MPDTGTNNPTEKTFIHGAIYTRKSHEEGLEQEFNSLDAQRESAEAYIESQRLQGWRALPDRYDDGGFSGGDMERPGLQRLLADVDAGKVDVIVVYKIDRLSRSLLDFMKMIERFNEQGVSFVSVTQHFNTTDPAGRMFLGILITFAQYEREVIAERIRDKVAAAKRRGKYCGGPAILGYDVDRERKELLVNPEEAPLVKHIFKRFTQLGSAKALAAELNEQGYHTKSWTTKKGNHRPGSPWNTGHIYRLLGNRTYRGEVVHKGKGYPGEHEAIVSKGLWEKVQAVLSENTRARQTKARTKFISPFQGVVRCGHCDGAMGLTYTQKGPRRYTYYHCAKDAKRRGQPLPAQARPGRGHREGRAGATERGLSNPDARVPDVLRRQGHGRSRAGAAAEAERATGRRSPQGPRAGARGRPRSGTGGRGSLPERGDLLGGPVSPGAQPADPAAWSRSGTPGNRHRHGIEDPGPVQPHHRAERFGE